MIQGRRNLPAAIWCLFALTVGAEAGLKVTSAHVHLGRGGFGAFYNYQNGGSAYGFRAGRAYYGDHSGQSKYALNRSCGYFGHYRYRYSYPLYHLYPYGGPATTYIYSGNTSYRTTSPSTQLATAKSDLERLADQAFGDQDYPQHVDRKGPIVEELERTIYYNLDGTRRIVVERRVYPGPDKAVEAPEPAEPLDQTSPRPETVPGRQENAAQPSHTDPVQ